MRFLVSLGMTKKSSLRATEGCVAIPLLLFTISLMFMTDPIPLPLDKNYFFIILKLL